MSGMCFSMVLILHPQVEPGRPLLAPSFLLFTWLEQKDKQRRVACTARAQHMHSDQAALVYDRSCDSSVYLLIAAHMQPRLAVKPADGGAAGPALAPNHTSTCEHPPPTPTPPPAYSWLSSQEIQLSLNEPNQRDFVFVVVDSEELCQLILDPQWLQSFGDTLGFCTCGGDVCGGS